MSDETSTESITYVHAPDLNRYEVRDRDKDDAVIGFTQYRLPDDVHVDFVHTEVDESYGGRGIAGELVAFALADVRAEGKRIIPHCPYVAKWIAKHPEYADITDVPA
ncbi:GNAT family N-acetyltransferase [Nocardioides caeni]|uniref:N-acetyltransferase n=1 Tax=Nocardioides caeni TaxID=574700 RepID=A0A4S8NKT6_9ACTN|nr:GNAT family N-acetyltransferase [Nocardioides caeni]THV17657.1 N-acetyltransferase [Nocardioides caeni]